MKFASQNAWTVITAIACASLVACQLAQLPVAAAISKLLASSGFVAVAVCAGAFGSRYGKILFAGLLLAACGDLFLLGVSQGLFLTGLTSFLLAHVLYIIAFLSWGNNHRWSLLAAFPILIVSLGTLSWLSPQVPSTLLTPVQLYTLVISLMVVAAFGATGAGGPALLALGAVMFYLSDLSVASGRFVATEFPNYVWGLPAYYSGQVLLARSVAAAVHGNGAGAAAAGRAEQT